MTVAQAMANAQAVTGQVFDAATLRRWLSELDGQLALDLYRADAWTPYTAEDAASLLLVPYPWDGLYVHHLEAMTYFSNGEYDRYQNALAMRESALGEFKRFVQRTKGVCGRIRVVQAGDGGTAVTIIDEGAPIWQYVSAYGTAVLRGYTGTVDEWLDSLKGEKGQDGTVEFDELTPEQIAMLTGPQGPKGDTGASGPQGPQGEDGTDGVSPVLSIGTVTTLPAGSQATASMGGTQAAPTLNLGIPSSVWIGTQGEYDALGSYNPAMVYLIVETVASIAVTTQPATTSYTEGDTLDLSGIAVTATYPSGATADVTASCSFSPDDGDTLSTAGTVSVTVSYTEGSVTRTTTFSVTVEAAA